MNTVIAQGEPNSLIRHFQDHPHNGVDLLNAAKLALARIQSDLETDKRKTQEGNTLREIISRIGHGL